MKILFVYHVSSVGGGSYCLLNIIKELDREKFEPIVLLRNNGPLIKELNSIGVRVISMEEMRTVPYNCSIYSAKRIIGVFHLLNSFHKFRTILREVSPDIVYINTMMLYPYLKVAKQMGFRSIIHIREHWEEGSHSIQRRLAISNIKKYADEIVAINSYSASMLEKEGRKVTIVYDWIDLSKRSIPMPLSSIFNEDCSKLKVFMYMGGLQEIKGPLEVLTSFSNLKDSNYRLLVLGIDPIVQSKGLSSLIKKTLSFIGKPSYSERVLSLIHNDKRIKCMPNTYFVKDLYDQIYCVLSYFTIPHANLSLAECVIDGVVCVAASTPESMEYSMNGELAILYPINSVKEFTSALKNIETIHPIVIEKLCNDSKVIEKLFDKKKNVNKLYNIFDRVLSVH